jgi:hypothetical protein
MPFSLSECAALWNWTREEDPTILSNLKSRMLEECLAVYPALTWPSDPSMLGMRIEPQGSASKTMCMTIILRNNPEPCDLAYEVIVCRDTGRVLRVACIQDVPENYDYVPPGMQDLTTRNVPLQLTSELVFDGQKIPDGYSSFFSLNSIPYHDEWKSCDSVAYTPDDGWFLARTLIPEQRFLVIVKDELYYGQNIFAYCFDTQRRILLAKFVAGGDTPAARGACLDGENLVVFMDENTNEPIHTTLYEDPTGTSDADTFGYKTAHTWTMTVPLEELINVFNTYFQ